MMIASIALVFPLILSATAFRFAMPMPVVTTTTTVTTTVYAAATASPSCGLPLPTVNNNVVVLSPVTTAVTTAAAVAPITATDAAVDSAVAQATADLAALVAAFTGVDNTIVLIRNGLVSNSVPPSLITGCTANTTRAAASLGALASVIAGGVSAASSASFGANVSAMATTVTDLSTALQQLQPAGPAFTNQFTPSLAVFLTALQALVTALKGQNNANVLAAAVMTLEPSISALKSST
ncbi:hypothetical protein C8R46DRAFT_1281613 [Mycena filopes]|nr:hypothetical protein C8R46DRAFT_1281613 [Mycena filopes]